MPRLTLRLEDRVLKQFVVDAMATIGRLPDNTIVVESPAVSGHHACMFRDGERFVVEDLASTNGTFVNGARVSRHALRDGDIVRVGKHTLVFDETAATKGRPLAQAERITSNPGETMFLDAEKYKSLLAMLKETEAQVTHAICAQAARAHVAVLRVVAGRADRPEYALEAPTSVVGKSDAALVRLQGWFKPKQALAIERNGDGYVATVLGGSTRINSQRLTGAQALADGDILEVSGLTLEFRYRAEGMDREHVA